MSNRAEVFFEEWQQDQLGIQENAPNVARGFGGLFQAVMKDGAMTVREKELVALGIGVAEACPPCIRLHVQKCLAAGATREEIVEAAGVAVMMRGGPAFTHVPEVLDALDHLAPETATAAVS